MHKIENDKIAKILEDFDVVDNMASPKSLDYGKIQAFREAFEEITKSIRSDRFSVVGIDILGYSQLDFSRQALVPVLLKILLEETFKHLNWGEYFAFSEFKGQKLQEKFIPTGDGGFLVLNDPLQAIIFSLRFASILHIFNSYSFYPSIRDYIGEIRVRYCITYDHVYEYERNFFGPGIINNHRIMSRDKLDRCLIDKAAQTWFLEKLNGIESLLIFNFQEIARKVQRAILKIPEGEKIGYSTVLNVPHQENHLRAIISQKIGSVKAKEQILDVYNIFIQLETQYFDEKTKEPDSYMVNLGNLNSVGLID